LKYRWDDIQDFVSALPIEKVITLYTHKDANNKDRYLQALCDRNVMVGQQAEKMAIDFEERLKTIKKKRGE